MFADLINLVFSGCETDIEKIFAMLLFLTFLELIFGLMFSVIGSGRSRR